MLTIPQLAQFLQDNHARFEIINHPTPIFSVQDAGKYFDSREAAPVFIMQTEKGLIALVTSATDGKIDFKELGKKLGFQKFKMADREKIATQTGYEAGTIPLVGHGLPTWIDNRLFDLDFIYGGTGDLYHTLKINPRDVERLNENLLILDFRF